MEAYSEPARDIPVAGSADVIVAGGGPAGLAAAIAAALAAREDISPRRLRVADLQKALRIQGAVLDIPSRP